jgi:ubiquinone/menaquinone biosynthesis C-methylase UbiE
MKRLDYHLQNWRYTIVEPFIPDGCEILDIGGFDGSFLLRVEDRIKRGVCIDPFIENWKGNKIEFMKGKITTSLPFSDLTFDVIIMLAVFEHLGMYQATIASESFRILKQNGLAILTVPSKAVDYILKVLIKLHLIDGMSAEEHVHFRSSDTMRIFKQGGFALKHRSRFQLGLNNLFIFQKVS